MPKRRPVEVDSCSTPRCSKLPLNRPGALCGAPIPVPIDNLDDAPFGLEQLRRRLTQRIFGNEQTDLRKQHQTQSDRMILATTLALTVQIALLAEPSRCATDASGGCSLLLAQESQSTGSQSSPGRKAAGDQAPTSPSKSVNTSTPVGMPRGKKLVLKDGSFQLIREYQKNGERIRYYSIERGDWEEIPASLVDWDATKKAETADEKTSAAMLEKARIQAEAAKMEPPLDVDASLTVAQGVFLPEGEGMFAVEGKSVITLQQAGSQIKTDKKNVLKQVLIPLPVVPGKRNVELPGAKAAVRVNSAAPEFYLREPPPDPDRVSSVERTGRQNESGPDVLLLRAKVKGNKRYIESMRSMFGQDLGEERDEISIQRWEVAPDVYKFTLGEPLPPGEYVLAEILNEGMNLFVWDFGVDVTSAHPQNSAKSPK